jgi:hypothetical protein
VSATIDGKAVFRRQGASSRLSPSPVWQPRDPARAPLLVGACGSRFPFTKILLTPVSGQGKRIR